MLHFNLHQLFKLRGIDHPYRFLCKAGITPHCASNLLRSQVRSINLGHVEKICRALHCTPNDLLAWEPAKDDILDEKHPLQRLRRRDASNFQALLRKVPVDSLPSLEKIILEHVNAAETGTNTTKD